MTERSLPLPHVRELPCGAVICAKRYIDVVDAQWFDQNFWETRGARRHTSTGRSPVLIVDRGDESWVLRHYRRGGAVARFVDDHYVYTGLHRTRAFREWQLLQQLARWGLPAPAAIAARVDRTGWLYQADIITRFLPDTQALSARLANEGVDASTWRRIGGMLRRFHDHGVDHPDLTAHNILVDTQGRVFLVDFDNAVLREPEGPWMRRGLARFERSLRKVALETGTSFDEASWQMLREAYAEGSERR